MGVFKEYLGELIGTFILVFIGCGSVAVAVLFGTLGSLPEVAIVFGSGVTIAILAVKSVCPAHLNPAVSIAMYVYGVLGLRKLGMYIISQFLGAMLGGLALMLLLNSSIANFESENEIVRGSSDSYKSAQMFGEFFPNPGFEDELSVTVYEAIIVETAGTFALIMVIFILSRVKALTIFNPFLVGLTVTILIIILAPYTQGGFNPARDFGPRLVAYFSGWGDAALPNVSFSFFTVYILGPSIAGVLAGRIQRRK